MLRRSKQINLIQFTLEIEQSRSQQFRISEVGFSGFNATLIKNNSGHGNLKSAQIALSVGSIDPKEMLMIVYFKIWNVSSALRRDFIAQIV